MRSMITLVTQVMMVALATGSAAAHSGHGIPGESFGIVHYATEPQHLGAGAVLALLAALSFVIVQRMRALRLQRTPRRRRTR